MTNQPKLKLRYDKPAPTVCDYDFARQNDSPEAGWEKWSLPLGNGFFGASIFGRVGRERIQITENSLCNRRFEGHTGATEAAGFAPSLTWRSPM